MGKIYNMDERKENARQARDVMKSHGVDVAWVAPQLGMTSQEFDKMLCKGISADQVRRIESAASKAAEVKADYKQRQAAEWAACAARRA